MLIEGKSAKQIFKELKLKEHHIYEVIVKCSENNIKHQSFLLTGFKHGSYCQIHNNSYEMVVDMKDMYYIEVVKELAEIKLTSY